MKANKANRRIGSFLSLFFGFGILCFFLAAQPVKAAGEAVHFGSESYEWEVGVENPIGIYVTADTTMESFSYVVSYDPDILEYVRGGTAISDNEIEVDVSGVNDSQQVTFLYFKPITSEATSITVSNVQVTGSDGTAEAEDVSVAVNGPLTDESKLEGITVNGIALQGFEKEKLDYSVYVPSDIAEAVIETAPADADVEISDTALQVGNNEVRITCSDRSGNQTVYTLHIIRLSDQTQEDADGQEEGAGGKEQNGLTAFLSNGRLTGRTLALALDLAALVLVFIVLCILKLHLARERRRREEYRRKKERREQIRSQRLKEFEEETFATEDEKEPEEAETAEDEDVEIRVNHVTMDFKREKDESSSIKEVVIRTLKGQRSFERFRALDDISFTVRRGEVVGIIGTNGSGKSTILKIISGALVPTQGNVEVDKRKVQLLTLGTGFDMELTGRENIYLNGAIIGYTKDYIDQKYDDIVKFAELEGFMEERVKNYSSGMVSRLGFAVATARDTPEILILDEVLSVGDMFFRKKSEARIQEMIHGGSTVLIVSHSTAVIRKNCTKVVWIEKGKLRAMGDPKRVCAAYEKMNG